jgi:hypothetical protein
MHHFVVGGRTNEEKKMNFTKKAKLLTTFAVLFVGIAVATSVHFKSGPVFTDQGLQLTAAGSLAGLGNGDLVLQLSASAIPTATCTNKGGNEAPGQNPATVNVTGAEPIPAGAIKNGNVSFSVMTQKPEQPTAAQAGCPSDNWTATITDLQFTSATITVIQNGATVLTQSFTLSCPSATTNGGIGQCTIQ